MDETQALIEQMLQSISYLIKQAVSHTTKIYDGMLIEEVSTGRWKIRFNGETKEISLYGSGVPEKNKMVKVIIPQGNLNLAYFMM